MLSAIRRAPSRTALGIGTPRLYWSLTAGFDEALDLPVGEIFAAALANCYIYCG